MKSFSFLLALALAFAFTRLASALEPAVLLATGANQPHMAIDADGNFYIVCIHQGNVSVLTSTDQGKTFSQPVIAIDAKGKAHGHKQRGPRIGVDAKKRLTVTCPIVLDAAQFSKKYPTQELVAVTSIDGGKTWTKPLQINEATEQAPEALHWMAVAPTGEVHVAWLDMRDRKEPGQDIYYAKIVDGKVGKNQKIATTVCECCAPGMALDVAGNPIVAYREGGKKPSREIFAVSSKDSGATFSKPTQVNKSPTKETSCPMSAPAVFVVAHKLPGRKAPQNSGIVFAWKDVRMGRPMISCSGALVASELEESLVYRESRGQQDHPSIAVTTGDHTTVWVAWEEKAGDQQRVFVLGSRHGPLELTTAGDGLAGFPVLATNGKTVALTYEVKKDGKLSSYFRLLEQ